MSKKILIIGGTQEGNKLADFFQSHNYNYIISYAGIVEQVNEKKFKKRVGGFGGQSGMVNYIQNNQITHIIDASHPFSNKISLNTFKACNISKTPLICLYRRPWYKKKKDVWIRVKSFSESTNYLKGKPKNIFLAIGKKYLNLYKKFDQHFYLLRLLENKEKKKFFTNQKCILSRGPFDVETDKKILKKHNIELIISKNSGGDGAYSKIIAARELKIPVIIISRPKTKIITKAYNYTSVLNWLNQGK